MGRSRAQWLLKVVTGKVGELFNFRIRFSEFLGGGFRLGPGQAFAIEHIAQLVEMPDPFDLMPLFVRGVPADSGDTGHLAGSIVYQLTAIGNPALLAIRPDGAELDLVFRSIPSRLSNAPDHVIAVIGMHQ